MPSHQRTAHKPEQARVKAVQRIRTQSTYGPNQRSTERDEYDAGEHAEGSERKRLIEAEVERSGRADGDELARSGEHAEANRPQKTQPQTHRERLFFICPRYFLKTPSCSTALLK